MVYEYAPVAHGKQRYGRGRALGRMTASTAEEQLRVHEVLGAPLQLELAWLG